MPPVPPSRRRRVPPSLALFALALSLAACSSDDGATSAGSEPTAMSTAASTAPADDAPTTSSPTAERSTTGSAPSSSSTAAEPSTTSTAAGTATTGVAAPGLALTGDGLLLVDTSDGSTTPLAFGTNMVDVVQGVSAVLGPPDQTAEGNPECGNGQGATAIWTGEIAIDFDPDGGFLSWILRPGSTLTDLTGVGLGSSYDELVATWAVDVEETTLGREFATSPDGTGLGGLLEGDGVGSEITELWAGPICAFR